MHTLDMLLILELKTTLSGKKEISHLTRLFASVSKVQQNRTFQIHTRIDQKVKQLKRLPINEINEYHIQGNVFLRRHTAFHLSVMNALRVIATHPLFCQLLELTILSVK